VNLPLDYAEDTRLTLINESEQDILLENIEGGLVRLPRLSAQSFVYSFEDKLWYHIDDISEIMLFYVSRFPHIVMRVGYDDR